ncbi:MAG: hypothetical protein AB8G14_15060 [Ilumatobacter sp.]
MSYRIARPVAKDLARPRGLAFDGESIWVANKGDDTVTRPERRRAVRRVT